VAERYDYLSVWTVTDSAQVSTNADKHLAVTCFSCQGGRPKGDRQLHFQGNVECLHS
jgi:hypothetical protein